MQITTKTFLQYCLHRTRFLFLHSGLAARGFPLHRRYRNRRRPRVVRRCSWKAPPSAASMWTGVSPLGGLLRAPLPNWSSAAVSLLSVRTARWRTSRRWTGHILPWSPVCSIAGRCDICFHSAWNRSATGRWPCYRLQGETGLEGKRTNYVRLHWHKLGHTLGFFRNVESKKPHHDEHFSA